MGGWTLLVQASSICSSAPLPVPTAVAGSHKGVVVDLAGVTFLASIGIRTLLLGAKAVQRRGGCLILLNPVDEVQHVLEVMGMTDLMPIFRDSEAALAVASGQA
jgi:anti-sigma B factor antagonist